jgi:hypothetical protein
MRQCISTLHKQRFGFVESAKQLAEHLDKHVLAHTGCLQCSSPGIDIRERDRRIRHATTARSISYKRKTKETEKET